MKVQDQQKREVWKYHIKLTGSCSTSISASSSPPPATQPSASQPTWFPVTAEEGGLDPRRENLQRSLSGDKERRLLSVRTEFIGRVSSSVVKDLLDALLQHRVINNREMESIQIMPSRADKARELIDTVLKKGNRACEILMDTFCEVDPFVSTMLNLQ
ncbi:caspase recruitment domain-containing protein 18-like isoform X2 [Thunnus thynnus]|uniref:caspase recruitment domain-containing protein 18-like isoform X2 n=1 Tax=Thunnus thynnus TaxID=8237 RepID=UPI003527FF69